LGFSFTGNSWGASTHEPGVLEAGLGIYEGFKTLQDKDLLTGLKGLKKVVANLIYTHCRNTTGYLNAQIIADDTAEDALGKKSLKYWFCDSGTGDGSGKLNTVLSHDYFDLIPQLDDPTTALENLKKILGFTTRDIASDLSTVTGFGTGTARTDHEIANLEEILQTGTPESIYDKLTSTTDSTSRFMIAKNQVENKIQSALGNIKPEEIEKKLLNILEEILNWDIQNNDAKAAFAETLQEYINNILCFEYDVSLFTPTIQHILNFLHNIPDTTDISNIKTLSTELFEFISAYTQKYQEKFEAFVKEMIDNGSIGQMSNIETKEADASAEATTNTDSSTLENAAAAVGINNIQNSLIENLNNSLKEIFTYSGKEEDNEKKKEIFDSYIKHFYKGIIDGTPRSFSELLTNDNIIKGADALATNFSSTSAVTVKGYKYITKALLTITNYKPDVKLSEELQNLFLSNSNITHILGNECANAMFELGRKINNYIDQCEEVQTIITNGVADLKNQTKPLHEWGLSLDDQLEMVKDGLIEPICIQPPEFFER